MDNRVAHNIHIPNLIGALSELLSAGNVYVDIMIDDELTVRLRKSIIKDNNLDGKNDEFTELDSEDIA